MKNITFFLLPATMVFLMAGCKKESATTLSPLVSLNVTNVVIGGSDLTLNTSTQVVPNNSFFQFALSAGNSRIDLYPAATPASPYYDETIQTANGGYYSLFLTGSSPAAIDKVLIKESYKNYTDSLCGVRFINLSPGSDPISVDVAGQAGGSTVQSLAYKSYSNFIQFAANQANGSYNFEIRDAATGNLITSYSLATPYFHNVTLALMGLPGSGTILQVNDY